ncbi:transport protein particle component [Hypoxylon fragiforme]|uniref:transport protein particle component n=1 Tax=Hypoxylon fragiforme TaxID=63214 RepID=UPI0020C650F8|nr:transport protein particle component [Hypoxylon fragiforme]KAI2613106.1 transport protein particle component [Hypoxylon fragiforme]
MSFDQPLPPFNASDPTATFLSTSCLDFLMIELVPMTYRVANELDASSYLSNSASASSPSPTASASSPSPPPADAPNGGDALARRSNGGGETATAAAGGARRLDEDEERDAVFFRLEGLGYRVGLGLVERFSRDRPRFNDTLDAIKFVCKDLWMLVFKKQVDNLKTNHRGVYVLTDNAFRPLSRMSVDPGAHAVVRAQPFLWFPCGVIRGALAAMGIPATVQAESNELPGAVFQIKTVPSKQ